MRVFLLAILALGLGVDAKNCADQVKELESKPKLFGSFKPVCKPDGTFEDVQCHESFCYCVDPITGEEIEGTKLRFMKPTTCPKKATKCSDVRDKLESSPPLLGAFKPECKTDGSYKEMQCHEGYCYCVFPDTGAEIKGTKVRFGKPISCKRTECVLQRHKAMSKKKLLGAFTPECNLDGSFKSIQCMEGYCYCVFPKTGVELLGTRMKLGKPTTCELTKCLLQRHNAKKSAQVSKDYASGFGGGFGGMGTSRLGAFVPKCKADGSFEPVQCQGSTCFCIFPSTGEEVMGTRVSIATPIKSCKLTKCVLERHSGWSTAMEGYTGVKVPRCDPYGKYKKMQCFKGMCWCTSPESGKPLKGAVGSYTIPKC